MATVRELVAQLGFKVDTTPATRFNAAIKRSRSELEKLDKTRLTGLTGFFTSPGFRTSIINAFTGLGIAAGAAFAVAVKTSTEANKINRALAGLEQRLFKTPEQFRTVQDSIRAILNDKTIGKFTNELELLNSIAAAFEISTDIPEILKNLPLSIKLAAIRPDLDLTQLLTTFAEVRATGDVANLKKLGVFTNQFLQIIEKTTNQFKDIGQIGVTEVLNRELLKLEDPTDRIFKKFVEVGDGSDQLKNTFSELVKEIGEKTLPIIRDLNAELTGFLDRIRKFVKGEIGIVDAVIEGFPSAAEPGGGFSEKGAIALGKLEDKIIDFFREGFNIDPLDFARRQGTLTQGNTQNNTTNNRGGDININVTVQPGGTGNAAQITSAIRQEFSRANGSTKEIAERTTRIRGGQ
jgi:hypothetical protein